MACQWLSLCCFKCQEKLQGEQICDKSEQTEGGKKSQIEIFSALKHSGEEGIKRACGREMINRTNGEGARDWKGHTSYSSCRQLTESLK